MTKINADNVNEYVIKNWKGQFKDFKNAFENFIFNVKMPFDEFSISFNKDLPNGITILTFNKHEETNKIYNELTGTIPEKELDSFVINFKQGIRSGGVRNICDIVIFIEEDGSLHIFKGDNEKNYVYALRQSKEQIKNTEHISLEEMEDVIRSLLFSALLTIQFMHCKNVTLVEKTVDKHQVKKKSKKRIPKKTYYVLNIEPMKQVLKTEGGIVENGITKALHICRGHFKTYKEKGLFGKHKGTFWFPQQTRGSKKSGEVIKDYNVQIED